MKKLLLLLITLIFLAVSCSGSKKAENNDNAVLPDEDMTDVDEDNLQPDEDNGGSGPFFVNICTGETKCYDSEKEINCPKEDNLPRRKDLHR